MATSHESIHQASVPDDPRIKKAGTRRGELSPRDRERLERRGDAEHLDTAHAAVLGYN